MAETYEITVHNNPEGEDENQATAVWYAQSLLESWRSRFRDGHMPDAPIDKTYPQEDGSTVRITSPNAASVTVTRMRGEEELTLFGFTVTGPGEASLDVGEIPEGARPPDQLIAFSDFSSYMSAADRREKRG
jgi:hypothetical protein